MKYELEKDNNKNNSKKLIIGISILFCTVILIIGTSLAFFTQSDSATTGNIVSSNDNNAYINYIEEKSMMFDNLIPMKGEDIENALNNDCVDDNGYNACSIYMFGLENTYGKDQKINISMKPTANSFTNLKFFVFKLSDDGIIFITEQPVSLEKNNLNPITLIESETLSPGEDNISTYAIIFYIESMDYDQTEEDAGKSFGATIRVDSITTGKYMEKTFGDSSNDLFGESFDKECWTSELIEGTTDEYKLTEFKGINSDGTIKEECNGYVAIDDNDHYSINIPSTHDGNKITTLGNNLFTGGTVNLSTLEANTYNNYAKIKSININEGITTIDDYGLNGSNIVTTFMNVGDNLDSGTYLEIKLPESLIKIGKYSFLNSNIKVLEIPYNVESLGEYAFVSNNNLTSLTFKMNSEGENKLTLIDNGVFMNNNIELLEIPKNIESIGNFTFGGNSNLTTLNFIGTEDNSSSLKTIGQNAFSDCGITSLVIPSSVTEIENNAFAHNIRLTSLTFKLDEKGNSNLNFIRQNAFNNCDLTYTERTKPLEIPSSVTTIESNAFGSSSNGTNTEPQNRYLNYIRFNGTLTDYNTYWYKHINYAGATIEILK